MSDQVLLKQLLEAGVHFGHQTRRWNPKMARFIFGRRKDIYIIDLQKTVKAINKAQAFFNELAVKGDKVLFVGTKKQAQAIIKQEAERCGAFYVNERWLGGMLTNFSTIRKSIKRLKDLMKMQDEGILEALSKKEQAKLTKEMGKLKRNLSGIVEMPKVPSAVWIVDAKREEIAIKEARKLHIPVVGIVDTNTDPDLLDYPIPANDDAIRSIKLITSLMADALQQGYQQYASTTADQDQVQLAESIEDTFEKTVEKAVEEETEAAEKKVKVKEEDRELDAKRKRRPLRGQM